jgi:hypothetical protein
MQANYTEYQGKSEKIFKNENLAVSYWRIRALSGLLRMIQKFLDDHIAVSA